MKLWLIVPVKPFGTGKSRLAGVLTPAQRGALTHELLVRTIRLAQAGGRFAGCLVVSRSRQVLAEARQLGASTLREVGPGGLNEAVAAACDAAARLGAERVLVLPADLPEVTAADLDAIHAHAAAGADVIVAPSQDGGTNALCLPLPPPFAFAFGPGSFACHTALAEAAGCRLAIYTSPTLAFDLDWPEDLQLHHASGQLQ
jgi:2-phospho-L-lactate guanylyltransferase